MKIQKINYAVAATLLLCTSLAQASKLFAANNTSTISINEAFDRVNGEAQGDLKDTTINTLQNDHYEQGRISNAVGTYYMRSRDEMTADNTLVYTTSPQESIPEEKIIRTAATLAKDLNQESVAVFVTDGNPSNSDILIGVDDQNLSYSELKNKIPQLEAIGLSTFTVYFKGSPCTLDSAKISAIEWLTTHDKLEQLKKVFAGGQVQEETGEALLVFNDGHTEVIS
jgi:hypothetical protein